ncbi:hypothetical protein NECID01_0955 [Nematocida sp. AWRm77]|nr:hypothetical protein NECID01_0955 [Nematocida sp. AWRm77]
MSRCALVSEDPLSSLIVQTETEVCAFKLSFNEETNTPGITVHAPRFAEESLSCTHALLSNVLQECIAPHEKYSFNVEIDVIKKDTLWSLLNTCVLGIAAVLLHSKVPMADTPVSYTKTTDAGSIWVCKGYFSRKLLSMSVNGEATEEEVLRASTHPGTEELDRLKQVMESVSPKQ